MRSRGLVVAVAIIVAAAAAGAVYLYTESVRREAKEGVLVIVARADIPAGTELDPLLENDQFTTKEVPEELLVEGAIRDAAELQGRVSNAPILAGEQIPSSRVSGGGEIEGGALGIRDGFQAMTVRLDAQRLVGDVLQVGDHVSLYATFQDVEIIRRLFGKGVTQGALSNVPPTDQTVFKGDFTVALVQDVRVLRIERQAGAAGGAGPVEDAAQSTALTRETLVTLELLPQDVADTIFSMETGGVWMSLLPPGGEPSKHDVVNIGKVLFDGVREAK